MTENSPLLSTFYNVSIGSAPIVKSSYPFHIFAATCIPYRSISSFSSAGFLRVMRCFKLYSCFYCPSRSWDQEETKFQRKWSLNDIKALNERIKMLVWLCATHNHPSDAFWYFFSTELEVVKQWGRGVAGRGLWKYASFKYNSTNVNNPLEEEKYTCPKIGRTIIIFFFPHHSHKNHSIIDSERLRNSLYLYYWEILWHFSATKL